MPNEKGATPSQGNDAPTPGNSIYQTAPLAANSSKADATAPVLVFQNGDRPATADGVYQACLKKAKAAHRKLDFLKLEKERKTKSIALKFYLEQLLAGQKDPKKAEQDLCQRFGFNSIVDANARISAQTKATVPASVYEKDHERYVAMVHYAADTLLKPVIEALDVNEVEVACMLHDSDLAEDSDSLFEAAYIKPHFHLWARMAPSKKNQNKRVRVFIKMFGIRFRLTDADVIYDAAGTAVVAPDMEVYLQGACQSIHSKFGNCLNYGTHGDKKSVIAGKHYYPAELYMTNIPPQRLADLISGLDNPSEAVQVKHETMVDLASKVELLAAPSLTCDPSELGNYKRFLDLQPTRVQMNHEFKGLYEVGRRRQERWYQEYGYDVFVPRVNAFVHGEGNGGKSYAARQSLLACGLEKDEIYEITQNGTGKTDDIDPHIKGLITSDVALSNTLNMADTHPCMTYRRNAGKGLWCGSFLIVTSNMNLRDWVEVTDRNIASVSSSMDSQEARQREYNNQQLAMAYATRFTSIHAEPERLCSDATYVRPLFKVLIDELGAQVVRSTRDQRYVAAGTHGVAGPALEILTGRLIFEVEAEASRLDGMTGEQRDVYDRNLKTLLETMQETMQERALMLADPACVKLFQYMWDAGYCPNTYPRHEAAQKWWPQLNGRDPWGLTEDKMAERMKHAITAWRSGSQLILPGAPVIGLNGDVIGWNW